MGFPNISPSCCAILLLLIAGQVNARHFNNHFKFNRSANHRSQCRPRLSSTHAEEASTSTQATLLASHTLSASSSTILAPHSATVLSSPVINPISSTNTSPLAFTTHSSSSSTSTPIASSTEILTVPSESPAAAKVSPVNAIQTATPQGSALVPNSNKAGIAGGDAYPYMKDHIGWWYDWSPNPSKPGKPIAVPMLWGDGSVDAQDAARLKAFEQIKTVPKYVLGFEEPDCPSGSGSADMSVEDGIKLWESLMAPLKAKGAKLGSPSMCKQADETWLAQFKAGVKTQWDFTAIHINKNSLAGVQKDIQHYKAYGKPIWVTEFACVNDNEQFTPCTNQAEINEFINQVVPFFEESNDVFAYGYSNGLGLGDVWPLMNGDSLSESGKTYLAAISKYH